MRSSRANVFTTSVIVGAVAMSIIGSRPGGITAPVGFLIGFAVTFAVGYVTVFIVVPLVYLRQEPYGSASEREEASKTEHTSRLEEKQARIHKERHGIE